MTIDATAADSSVPGLNRPAAIALLALLLGLGVSDAAWPQVPDNRGVRLDPEDEVSPFYRDTINERDRQRLDEAQESGGSFVPTFQGEGRSPNEAPPAVVQHGSGTVAAPDTGDAPVRAERPVTAYESVIHREAHGADGGDGLAAMVGVLIEGWTRPSAIARVRYGQSEARADGGGEPDRTGDGERDGRPPPVRAGDGFYARTLYGVDSDYPGPVVLELLQPPLTGAVVHGGFERVRQRLMLRLTSLTWRGRAWPIDAWGVDPDCACYGIAGEVDRHFLSRVLLPAAARFAEGFLDAVAMPARTIAMHDGTVLHERGESVTEEALYAGAAAATRTLGDILVADAPKETTVRIPRGTPLVVMVASDVAAPPEQR